MCNIFMYICMYIHILCQHSDLFPVSLQMESARKAWENSPNVREKGSPVTSTAPPIASGVSSSAQEGPDGNTGSRFPLQLDTIKINTPGARRIHLRGELLEGAGGLSQRAAQPGVLCEG